MGNGQELFKSPRISTNEPALKISVPIKGYNGISLVIEGDPYTFVLATPLLIKQPPTIPKIISPTANAHINHNTPFLWEAVDGATGYLLEMQVTSLANQADQDSESRFLLIRLSPDVTLYNFNVNSMPKGKWRWRVHALSATDFLGEMTEWNEFTSQ